MNLTFSGPALLIGLALGSASPALAVTTGGLPLANAQLIYTTQAGDDYPSGVLADGDADPIVSYRGYPTNAYFQTTSATAGSTATASSVDAVRDIAFQIRATADAVPDTVLDGRSFAIGEVNLVFQLDVTGAPGAYVPVDMAAVFRSQGETDPNPADVLGIFGQATGFAQLEIGQVGGDSGGDGGDGGGGSGSDFYLFDTCNFPGCTQTIDDSYTKTLWFPTGTVFQVDEAVWAEAAALPTGVEIYSSVSADPTFTIDPTYLASNPDTSLSFSAGFAPAATAPAPEPVSWTLMLAGVGLAGGALRDRRRTAAASR